MQPKPKSTEPASRSRDILLKSAMIRLGNIDDEVRSGYEVLRKYKQTVTVFGSARTPKNTDDYQNAKKVGYALAKAGFTVVTGGGHGIMGAANEGAAEAGGDSIGFNIALPHEQTLNEFCTESFGFSHFAPRKIVMTLYANAYVYFPGGFGTFDELSEILTLIQTGKTLKAPIILFDSEFWKPFDDLCRNDLLKHGTVSDVDLDLYKITDNVEEVIRLVKENKTYV